MVCTSILHLRRYEAVLFFFKYSALVLERCFSSLLLHVYSFNYSVSRIAENQCDFSTPMLSLSSEAGPTFWSCYANLNHYHYLFLYKLIPYTVYKHRKNIICMTKCRAGFATAIAHSDVAVRYVSLHLFYTYLFTFFTHVSLAILKIERCHTLYKKTVSNFCAFATNCLFL